MRLTPLEILPTPRRHSGTHRNKSGPREQARHSTEATHDSALSRGPETSILGAMQSRSAVTRGSCVTTRLSYYTVARALGAPRAHVGVGTPSASRLGRTRVR